eukprot:TRINITY_DN29826_c0_g1_i1.p1 TRINITY_DN29826_c0_g1~~TRINITY_DN29826_c0_g1_i1.p1  ORF type:complete len:294 (-),score=49.14 TRINITY_DN29826_c0_g1_i1:104-985(-)
MFGGGGHRYQGVPPDFDNHGGYPAHPSQQAAMAGYPGYPAQQGMPGQYAQGQGFDYGQQAGFGMPSMATTTSMNLVFFAASCCVIGGAFLGGIVVLFSGRLVDFLNMTYMLIFGCILAILDTPFFKSVKLCQDLKVYIGKYINILTRVTGKGVCFVFLGAALLSGMFHDGGVFFKFLAVVLGMFVMAVGVIAIVIGSMKSRKLKMLQDRLVHGVLENEFRNFSRGQSGLTPREFGALSEHLLPEQRWEDADLKLIFNALSLHPKWRAMPGQDQPLLPLYDLQVWVNSGLPVLL